MNTVQLECFVAVAEHLNFSKASRALKITQPAVSHQIQALEEELEVKLFIRTSKNVTLTQEGILFLADAQLILKTAFSAKERLSRHEHLIPFDLGCHNYMELNLLPPVLQKLSQEFPLLRPSIKMVPFPSLLGLVENNQIYAALGIRDEKQISPLYYRQLCTAPMACICAKGHPLSRYKTLTSQQLTGNFIVCSPRQLPDSIFAMQNRLLVNLPMENRFLTESVDSAFALVKAQIGYTLYPDVYLAREEGLCYIPVTDLPEISFGIYCQNDHGHPVLRRFLTLMAQHLGEDDDRREK